MDPNEIAKKIDHTLLKPNPSGVEFRRLFRKAFMHRFRAVCINTVVLDGMPFTTRKRLKKNGILIACVIDFPLGQGGYGNKHFAATIARDKRADELDVVWNIGAFLDDNYADVLRELKPLANVLPTKVIVEVGYILNAGCGPRKTKALLRDAVHLIRESGAFCIKDCTGFGPSVPVERRAEYIRLWKETEPGLLVKTASGIRTFEDARILLEAGADILGTSAGDKIMEEVTRSAKS